jgi:hypothetical protein
VNNFTRLPRLLGLAVLVTATLTLGLPAGATQQNGSLLSNRTLERGPSALAAGGIDCPKPSLTMFGARPTSISGPFLLRPNPLAAAAASGFVGTCRWKLAFTVHKHDPSVYVTTGPSIYLVPGVIDGFDDLGDYGVKCAAYYTLDNGFGGSAAQAELESKNCNTDGFQAGEASVTIDDSNLDAGPTVAVAPKQKHWYISYVFGGTALVGHFTFCSQDPLGQHEFYACVQFVAGPFEYT